MKQYDRIPVMQFFRLLNMFTVARCSETRLFRQLNSHIAHSLSFRKYISFEGPLFFSKCSKFDVDFRYTAEKLEKIFRFLENYRWIACHKFFLIRGQYLSSAVHLLTKTPRILDPLRWTFSNSIFSKVMKQFDVTAVVQVFRLFNLLTVARCSKTRVFRHLSYHIFHGL